MSSIALQVALMDGSARAEELWSRTLTLLEECGLAEPRYKVVGQRGTVRTERVLGILRKDDTDNFEVAGERVIIAHRPTQGRGMSYKARFASEVSDEFLERWVLRLADVGKMVFARAFDPEYDRWQNETWLENYESARRDATGLPRCWDEDFQTERVDISRNPGRWVAREGYMEALGHLMWLPPGFWQATGADRKRVCAELNCTEIDGLTRVRLSPTPFRDFNSPSERARALLFPTDEEPPSGQRPR